MMKSFNCFQFVFGYTLCPLLLKYFIESNRLFLAVMFGIFQLMGLAYLTIILESVTKLEGITKND